MLFFFFFTVSSTATQHCTHCTMRAHCRRASTTTKQHPRVTEKKRPNCVDISPLHICEYYEVLYFKLLPCFTAPTAIPPLMRSLQTGKHKESEPAYVETVRVLGGTGTNKVRTTACSIHEYGPNIDPSSVKVSRKGKLDHGTSAFGKPDALLMSHKSLYCLRC